MEYISPEENELFTKALRTRIEPEKQGKAGARLTGP